MYNLFMNNDFINEKQNTHRQTFRSWFHLCPVRHVLTFIGVILILLYFFLRRSFPLMLTVCSKFVRPWHRFIAHVCNSIPFSVAELLIVSGVICAVLYIVFFIIRLFHDKNRLACLYRFILTCCTAFSLIYGGFCLLWGVYYYSADFEEQSGIHGQPVDTATLETVTYWFTDLVNQYSEMVPRDSDGCFCLSEEEIFAHAPYLYHNVENILPSLSGEDLSPKPFFFSRALSYLNFTGFFFPFTGEANINTDMPRALMPSTIAHELAHQRGVAEEDEANFVAVLSCFEDGDANYCYSAALMAYIYLGNALYRSDYEAWAVNYSRLCENVRADLSADRAYWDQFETPVSTISDTVYTGFLQSYGQSLGLQTYGKCVDLLIAYYYETALEATS